MLPGFPDESEGSSPLTNGLPSPPLSPLSLDEENFVILRNFREDLVWPVDSSHSLFKLSLLNSIHSWWPTFLHILESRRQTLLSAAAALKTGAFWVRWQWFTNFLSWGSGFQKKDPLHNFMYVQVTTSHWCLWNASLFIHKLWFMYPGKPLQVILFN